MSTHCFVLMNGSRCLTLVFYLSSASCHFHFLFSGNCQYHYYSYGLFDHHVKTMSFFFFFLGRINKTMSLGHGIAFSSFLFFYYFSLILDIAFLSFGCLPIYIYIYIYIYTIKRAAKRQQLHTANEAEQEGNFLLFIIGSKNGSERGCLICPIHLTNKDIYHDHSTNKNKVKINIVPS